MESNLHHNAVITGYVDAYCLICESVHRPENAFNHIDKPVHKKNLDAAPYVEKYKDEHIRKVCICNTAIVNCDIMESEIMCCKLLNMILAFMWA